MSSLQAVLSHLPGLAVDVLRLSIWLLALTMLFVPLERFFGQRHASSASRPSLQPLHLRIRACLRQTNMRLVVPRLDAWRLDSDITPDAITAAITHRPIVVPDNGRISIEIVSAREPSVNFDMQSLASLLIGDRITVNFAEAGKRVIDGSRVALELVDMNME